MQLNSLTYNFCPRLIIASLLYCIVGGPHMLGAFPYDYQWYPTLFSRDLPIYVSPLRPYLHS